VKIAYIVSHGFAARMVMQTNLLSRLVNKNIEVALIAPDGTDKNLYNYCRQNGIDLYEFNPKSDFWTSNYIKSRMYFLENINGNPALYEKYIYDIRFNTKGNFKSKLRVRLLKLIHDLKEVFPTIKRRYLKKEEKMLHNDKAVSLIKEINPDLVVSTYPVSFSESQLIVAAKKQNAKTIMHILSWDNISCKGRFPTLADEYITWGPIMSAELKEYYNVEEKHIHECGVPHFDLHREHVVAPDYLKYLAEFGLDSEKPYLFFGMSSPRFAPYEIDIVEWLSKKIDSNAFGKDMQLIVRPHPQNVQGHMADPSWLPRLRSLSSARTGVDFPKLVESKMPWSMQEKDMVRLSQLLVGAIVSLNSGSTLSIDSLMCDTPVVLTSFDGDREIEYWKSSSRLADYVHLKKLISFGGIPVARSYSDLQAILVKYVSNKSYLKKERVSTLLNQCANLSRATYTAANELAKQLKK